MRPRPGARLPPGDVPRQLVEVQCCQCTQQLPVRLVLAADPGRGGRKLADFLIRLRCQAFGARPVSAVLLESVAGQAAARAEYGAPAGWRLDLLGHNRC